MLLRGGPSLGSGSGLRLGRWPGLGLRGRTGLGCGAGLGSGSSLRLGRGPGFGARAGVWLAGALFRSTRCWALAVYGALLISGLTGGRPGWLDCGLAGALLVSGLAGGGARLGHRTAFVSGLARSDRLRRGLTGALAAVGWTGHVLASDLGLLLFASHCWRGCRDGASGGDGAGHGNFSRSAAVGRVELLLVLGRGLSYLTLLRERRGAVLATGS